MRTDRPASENEDNDLAEQSPSGARGEPFPSSASESLTHSDARDDVTAGLER